MKIGKQPEMPVRRDIPRKRLSMRSSGDREGSLANSMSHAALFNDKTMAGLRRQFELHSTCDTGLFVAEILVVCIVKTAVDICWTINFFDPNPVFTLHVSTL
jgi:hypothetical protein